MNVIAWLRTPIATLIVLCAALLAQLPHAADVFRLIVAGEGWPAVLHGYAYAVALELAVLLFVVQRRDLESYIFAGVSVMVNLSYYSLHGIHLFSVIALPAWLVSIALPAAIARYSHLLVDELPSEAQVASDEQTPRAKKTKNRTREDVSTPVALPDAILSHSSGTPEGAAQTVAVAAQPEGGDVPTISKTKRVQQLQAEGYTASEIVSMTGITYSTVQSAMRRAVAQTNGVHQ